MNRVGEELHRIIERDRDRGFDDPERLAEHYRETFGVEVADVLREAVEYIQDGRDLPALSVAVSLAGRMFEVGWALRGEQAKFVVVGRDVGQFGPSLATGPFTTRERANEFRDLLGRTASGTHYVLSLHTPTDS